MLAKYVIIKKEEKHEKTYLFSLRCGGAVIHRLW
jgi:hypothetical protein